MKSPEHLFPGFWENKLSRGLKKKEKKRKERVDQGGPMVLEGTDSWDIEDAKIRHFDYALNNSNKENKLEEI